MVTGLVLAGCLVAGCGAAPTTPRVVYLEGSWWFTSARSVRAGLRDGGYHGAFETFTWTSFLGWGADHFVAARSPVRARLLAHRIKTIREHNPEGVIHVMALSAGTGLLVKALEVLPDDVMVDNVVLFSSSLSADRDLSDALRHVRGRLYATCSEHDGILKTLAVNADGGTGPAAGQRGFVLPASLDREERLLYAKVVNLPWQPGHLAYGWDGGHVPVTNSHFVRSVITPRVLSGGPFPLDRPMVVVRAASASGSAAGASRIPSQINCPFDPDDPLRVH